MSVLGKMEDGHALAPLSSMDQQPGPPPEQARLAHEGIFALARELIERASQLARKEVELARAEAKIDVARGRTAGELGAVAAVAAIGALACALIAVCDALGRVMPVWLIALVLCALLLGAAAIAGLAARRDVRRARPRRSIREAQATVRMLQQLRPQP
jgi:hypothetical protein